MTDPRGPSRVRRGGGCDRRRPGRGRRHRPPGAGARRRRGRRRAPPASRGTAASTASSVGSAAGSGERRASRRPWATAVAVAVAVASRRSGSTAAAARRCRRWLDRYRLGWCRGCRSRPRLQLPPGAAVAASRTGTCRPRTGAPASPAQAMTQRRRRRRPGKESRKSACRTARQVADPWSAGDHGDPPPRRRAAAMRLPFEPGSVVVGDSCGRKTTASMPIAARIAEEEQATPVADETGRG